MVIHGFYWLSQPWISISRRRFWWAECLTVLFCIVRIEALHEKILLDDRCFYLLGFRLALSLDCLAFGGNRLILGPNFPLPFYLV